jgi:hypothetical protein
LSKLFAPNYSRESHGWVEFPSDAKFRQSYFWPEEAMNHPAKLNLYLQESIIDYVGSPGETILDPTSGTGSLLLACTKGINVILIEIEEGYHLMQQKAVVQMEVTFPETKNKAMLIRGDCRQILPLPCNHIMFSPPYATAMKITHVRKEKEGSDNLFRKYDEWMRAYSKDTHNLSMLNPFLYGREMERIYKLCYDSILPGGSLTVVIKDREKLYYYLSG